MHTGHRERLRARVEGEGPEGLRPHEALEFLLCYAVPRRDVNGTAHALIERFGSLDAVLDADEEALCAQEGVGRHAARFLSAFGRAARACALLKADEMPRVTDDREALSCADALPHAGEGAVQLCLDMDDRLIYLRRFSEKRDWGAPECLREALRDALLLRAAGVRVVVYAKDGAQDLDHESAERYEQALRAAGVRLCGVSVARARS